MLEQLLGDLVVALPARPDERRRAELVADVDLGPVYEELPDDGRVAPAGRPHQGAHVVLPLRVRVRSPRQEQSGQVRVTLVTCPHERCPPALKRMAVIGTMSITGLHCHIPVVLFFCQL